MDRSTARKLARKLVEQMTLEEKASQLKYDAPAIKRLNIPAYNWWNEGLHGIARAGTATIFPQAIAMAAVFDDVLIRQVADVIATEGRAKYNAYSKENDRDIYKGLTLWSPNINIFRDPRWGRGHETYGEDPYLTGILGVAFIKGLQGEGEYLKTAACAKHYLVHSGPESLRHEFNAEVSQKDLYETYLPAFEKCIVEANVEAVMGAYNRVNGEVCCGSKLLIQKMLREDLGFEGHYVSDCWAIRDFHEKHLITSTPMESAAMALKAGCDLNCGNTYLHILNAYYHGLVSEEDITKATERLFVTRYMLGLFDETEFDDISYDKVECKEHMELSEIMAQKSIVLLKNNGILPLEKDSIKSIAVIGPNANSRKALIGNYHGTSSSYITVLEGIINEVDEDIRIHYSEGCHLFEEKLENLAYRQDRISEAVIAAKNSELVILVLGLDASLEGEEGDTGNSYASGDKEDLSLPQVQIELLEAVVKVGKPVVLCMMTGSAMDLNYANENVDAILQLWYPGSRGGKAVAELLFGKYSPSGKLPITFYKDLNNIGDFTDYSMKGRTYRYIDETPLYPFGFGLTYSNTKIEMAKIVEKTKNDNEMILEVDILNQGNYDTEEVIQIYIKDLESKYAVKNYKLCAFKRVSIEKAVKVKTFIAIARDAFNIIDDKGQKYCDSNKFELYIGTCQPDERSIELSGTNNIKIGIEL